MIALGCTVRTLWMNCMIVAEDEYEDKVVLPFQLSCIISHLNVEPITSDKWDHQECPHIK